ncbi:MAG: polyamine aminopropyltransferase [Chitinivibrionales bacterium]|nr:polyamine aminopropyltransferase [Chitinivibrionales bacterium]MBD3395189.1 polyamine aminopropyltransferase [Chitinivibrionales bacterium]
MNNPGGVQASDESALWIENLVDGLSGITLKAKHAVCCEASPFQKIEVFDTYTFGRVLLLGGTIVFTERDEHIYNEMITHPALVTHPAPKTVCVIGGGDGGCLREVLKYPCVKKVSVVEIDRQVTDVVKRFFPKLAKGFDDKRVDIAFKDGHEWLQANKQAFDIVLVDSYDPAGPVQSLETANFLELVRNSLALGGIAVLLTDAPELNRDKIQRTVRDLTAHFAWRKPYVATIPSFPLGTCSFVMCGTEVDGPGNPDASRLKAVARKCRYFCADIMQGAFCLPKTAAEIFNL